VAEEAGAALAGALEDLARPPQGPPPAPCPLEADPQLEGRRPRGRTFEDLAELVADALEHGAPAAAERHGMRQPAFRALLRRWRQHPRIVELVAERWPAIEARQRERARKRGEPFRRRMLEMLEGVLGR
jgi:hypothetical protein